VTTTTTSEELQELRNVTRSFLERGVPSVDLRAEFGPAYEYDKDAWNAMAENLGLQGLVVPEVSGGLGMGIKEMAVVVEEFGRALYNGPFISSAVIASTLLADSGTNDLLAQLASGEAVGAVVEQFLPGHGASSFRSDGSGISGESIFVIGADEATLLLVPISTDDGVVIIGIDRHDAGVHVEVLDSIDILRPVSRVRLENANGRVLLDGSAAQDALAEARIAAYIALAAESIGAAALALEMTVAYVGQRVQFGRVLAGFQSVKHRCAEMLVQLEAARGALYVALHEEGSVEERSRAASLAKVTATDAFFFVADETVHLHGGIGFTWEHSAHLFYRRAKANQLLFGTQSQHRRVMFRSLLPTYQ
jgi:alkylation response protein AidB-like acyl-CoA dehydrogenase